ASNMSNVGTAVLSGTSMASPHVAGVAAMYVQANPAASPVTVASVLTGDATAFKVGNPGAGSPNRLLFSRVIDLYWRYSGALAGKTCTQIQEASDPDTWSDNYLCSNGDYGIKWSSSGPLAGMRC